MNMLTIAITDGTIRPWDDAETKKIFWHSSAHLMAEALEALYPGVKFGVGPAVEEGVRIRSLTLGISRKR